MKSTESQSKDVEPVVQEKNQRWNPGDKRANDDLTREVIDGVLVRARVEHAQNDGYRQKIGEDRERPNHSVHAADGVLLGLDQVGHLIFVEFGAVEHACD